MRAVGDIYLDLEKLYDELINDHGFQMGDVIYWIYGHLKVHHPNCIEEYVADGSNPELKYGPRINRKSLKRKIFKELKKWEDCKIEPRIAEAVLKIIEKEQK